MKHPDDVALTERKFSDYFPMPGISLLLVSLTWAVFFCYFVAMLKDHCHRVKEMHRMQAIRRPVKADLVEKTPSLRNSLRNPLLQEKASAEGIDRTDKNVNPSAETTTSKEVVKPSKETIDPRDGEIKPSAEMADTKETKVSPSAELISPSAEAINNETKPNGAKLSKEMLKEPISSDGPMTYSELMKKEKQRSGPSAEGFKDTPEGRAKQAAARKTWQQVKHKPSAEIAEEKWRAENLGGKSPIAAKELSKEPQPPPKKKEICASSENIVVTASAEHM